MGDGDLAILAVEPLEIAESFEQRDVLNRRRRGSGLLVVPFDDRSHYWVQRVTFRNVTLGLEWSKDVIRKQPPVTFTLLGRPTDKSASRGPLPSSRSSNTTR